MGAELTEHRHASFSGLARNQATHRKADEAHALWRVGVEIERHRAVLKRSKRLWRLEDSWLGDAIGVASLFTTLIVGLFFIGVYQ